MRAIVAAGADVLRINLAHVDVDISWRDAVVANYRDACVASGRHPCICVDLAGSEMRTSWLIDRQTRTEVKSITLAKDQLVTLYGAPQQDRATFVGWQSDLETRIGVNYETLGDAASVGSVVCMDDGQVRLQIVERVSINELRCRVLSGCELGSHKRVFLPDLHGPTLTSKDMDDIRWAASRQVTYIAASSARCEDDVFVLREALTACPGGEGIRCLPFSELLSTHLHAVEEVHLKREASMQGHCKYCN
jgi:pyruvate kinase